jgi:hypothetical protein
MIPTKRYTISMIKKNHASTKKLLKLGSFHDLEFTSLIRYGLGQLFHYGFEEVLNSGSSTINPIDPARELSILTKQLKSEAIDPTGKHVDYAKLAQSETYDRFKEFTKSLPKYNIADIGDHEEQMAFWINLYNTLIMDAIIHYQIKETVLSISGFFRKAAYNIGGHRFSLDDIEHGILRRNRSQSFPPIRSLGKSDPRKSAMVSRLDPRLHFALVCGATSCPPIAFYDAAHLDQQLAISASNFINGGGASYDPDHKTVWLSKIFKWYQSDFGGWEGVKAMICEASSHHEVCEAINRNDVKVRYQPYDWSINSLI